jgi:threonine/homoserine/homoserine lactone efflux protein
VIQVWPFVAVAVPLVLIPGASTAVVLRNSIAGGTRAGIITAAGINAGSFCYGLLCAFGFAAVLQRWPSVWTVLRASGVLYLSWLGAQSLRRAANPGRASLVVISGETPRDSWRYLYEGFVTNALNPAIATFYLVVLPQFIPRGAPIAASALTLTLVHLSLAGIWLMAWATAGGTLARTLESGRPRRILEAVSGMALLALALKVAVSSR